jgi:hypothetical protein
MMISLMTGDCSVPACTGVTLVAADAPPTRLPYYRSLHIRRPGWTGTWSDHATTVVSAEIGDAVNLDGPTSTGAVPVSVTRF